MHAPQKLPLGPSIVVRCLLVVHKTDLGISGMLHFYLLETHFTFSDVVNCLSILWMSVRFEFVFFNEPPLEIQSKRKNL